LSSGFSGVAFQPRYHFLTDFCRDALPHVFDALRGLYPRDFKVPGRNHPALYNDRNCRKDQCRQEQKQSPVSVALHTLL